MAGYVEVDDPDEVAAHHSPGLPVLDLHAVDEHPVELAIAGFQRRPLRARQLAIGVVEGVDGQGRVQFGEGVPQPVLQNHLIVVVTLGIGRFGGDIRAVRQGPAQVGKPG